MKADGRSRLGPDETSGLQLPDPEPRVAVEGSVGAVFPGNREAHRHATTPAADAPPRFETRSVDFDRTPFTVIWEVTRACDLRCLHCRADAHPWRDPRELTTAEGMALLEQIHALGSPVFVLTGGDPLKRPDIYALVAQAVRLGLAVAVTPSGTPLLDADAVRRLADLGVRRLALSLDGPTAAVHDGFRGQPGSFAHTVAGLAHARTCQLPVQINTTVTRRNLAALPAIAERVGELGAAVWSAFFLVTVGRAAAADQLTAQECEDVFAFLHGLAGRAPFAVRTTAAPHYRRFALQQQVRARRAGRPAAPPSLAGVAAAGTRAPRGVSDGNGFVFVSHTGDVFPSGFLPLRAGTIRSQPLAEIYRDAPLLRRLRDPSALGGKCGACEFRRLCGGSRARAFAVTGDPLAEDPLCAYRPGNGRVST
jgi:radical SAM protein